ncbi:MAG: Mfa1 family fimbria major subunit [Muribaculaceae bacterium]|nr:Mfa1 family fimbria major subunit [Muribaculaceae bacterium]
MKKLFLPLLAAMALVSCSQNEPNSSDDGKSNDVSYVAVNIVQPGGSTRAGSPDFEDGTDVENFAQQGLFFIFNEGQGDEADLVGNAQRLALSPSDKDLTTTPAVEKIYSAVLVVDGVEEKPTENIQIVCILNAPAGIETGIKNLKDLTNKMENYDAHTKGSFIMSNSVYRDGGSKVLGATVTSDNLKQSSAEALANPVQIYVERVVAKVDVTTKGEGFTYETMEPMIDGVKKPLYINIKGLEIANIAESSYLLKNISNPQTPTAISPFASDPANKRSYWESCSSGLTYYNQSYNTINAAVENFDIATATLTQYIQPNTTSQKTSVLVTAQLTTDEEGTQPFSFIYLKGGYFTPDHANALLASYLANTSNFWYKTGETADNTSYTQLPATAFEWKNKNDFEGVTLSIKEDEAIKKMEDYEVIGRLKDGIESDKLYKAVYNAENKEYTYVPASVLEINEALLSYVAEYWNDGMCYYFMEIDQTPVLRAKGYTGTDTYFGVVRNHIYKLDLTSIRGLGTPVFDPNDVIIPTRRTEDQLWYLAAEVRVLSWRVVNQSVSFDM